MSGTPSRHSVEDNKALTQRFYNEIWNQKQLSQMSAIVSPTFCWHEPYNANDIVGIEAAIAFLQMLFTAFPDYTVAIDDLFGEGDRIAVRWLGRGTHLGALKGIQPSGNDISVPGMSILRIETGKLAEYWTSLDSLLMMMEIGAFGSESQLLE